MTAHELDAHLEAVLAVETLGSDSFEGRCPDQSFGRVYGGQVAAQSLLAAAATVGDGLAPISSSTLFLKIGAGDRNVRYEVERSHDGGSLAVRLVHAYQGDRLLALSTASFQSAASEHELIDHEDGGGAPAPDPETLPTRSVDLAEHFGERITGTMAMGSWPIDVRYIERAPWTPGASAPRNRLWMRSAVPLGDDPLVHQAALVYAADLHLPEPILFPAELSYYDLVNVVGVFGATLDYTVWFHRPLRFDRWLLHEQESPAVANSRGLTTSNFRDATGLIVASASESVGIFRARNGTR